MRMKTAKREFAADFSEYSFSVLQRTATGFQRAVFWIYRVKGNRCCQRFITFAAFRDVEEKQRFISRDV